MRAERLAIVEFGLFVGLLLMLVWAPLPLASNRTWALGFLTLGLLLLLAGAVVVCVLQGQSVLARMGAGCWPLLCIGLYALLLGVQCVPGLGADQSGRATISLDAFNTLQYLLATLAYAAGFALTLLLVRSERRVQWLLGTLVGIGALEALLAIGLFASHAEHMLFFTSFTQGSRATGSFANFDHLAAYMNLCLSAGIGLMLANMKSGGAVKLNYRQRAVAALNFMMSGKMLVRLMLVVMVITLVLTRSRMGNVAFFTSLVVVGGLGMVNNPRLRRTAFWLVLSLVVVDVVIVGQWVGLDRVVERLQNTAVSNEFSRGEETLEQRAQTPRQALGLVAERPVLGFGGGSFYTVFPRFKSADKVGYWDYAHNDYVQIAAETGLLGLGLLGLVVVATLWRLTRLWREEESRLNRGVAFGVAMAVCGVLIHSWVDFTLQIPANALTFCVLLALVWVLVPGQTKGNR